MQERTRFERLVLSEDTLELVAHGWNRSQRVVSEDLMATEKRNRLGAGLYSQSLEGVA